MLDVSVYVGYWRQRADETLGDPLPKVYPGAFIGQRQGWKTPRGSPGGALQRTPWWCTASACVAVMHFWEISLG